MHVVPPDDALRACVAKSCDFGGVKLCPRDFASEASTCATAFNEELDLGTVRRCGVSLTRWLCTGVLMIIVSGATVCSFQGLPRSAKQSAEEFIELAEVGLQVLGNHSCKTDPNVAKANISESVTAIGEEAFYDCYFLSSVTIPTSVTMIGEAAFQDAGLTSVSIPDSVTSLGEKAFWCCPLDNASISKSLTKIPAMAFAFGRKLRTVTIPESVTYIGHAAFYLSGLVSVCLPENVTDIGEQAFCNVNVTLAGFANRSFEGQLRECGCNLSWAVSC